MESATIIPVNSERKVIKEDVPVLLKGWDEMNNTGASYTPLEGGHLPNKRPLEEHLKYGYISLDKPANPSTHEVVSWIKRILRVEKTSSTGTLDPAVTGECVILLNRGSRLTKAQQEAGKQYVCLCRLGDPTTKDPDFVMPTEQDVIRVLQELTGPLLQRPPEKSAVKRVLRVRKITNNTLLEYKPETRQILFTSDCQAGTYMRTLCEHIGIMLRTTGTMEELRRSRSGHVSEMSAVTMHDLLDAQYHYDHTGSELLLREAIHPLEDLLVHHKRIIVKDSCINALCYGAPLHYQGILRYDAEIVEGDVIVLVSTKGEAIALATAGLSSFSLQNATFGIAARIKRVIMDKDTYKQRWGKGPRALQKKKLKEDGMLDKYGRPNDRTPPEWFRKVILMKGEEENRKEEGEGMPYKIQRTE
ncbi:hypothetical protein PCE1_000951 [Barthelona sp. PCE]